MNITFHTSLYTCSGSTEDVLTRRYKLAPGPDTNSIILIEEKRTDYYEVIEYIVDMYKDFLKYKVRY